MSLLTPMSGGVPVSFALDSRFNKDAEYKKVRFGQDGRLLEVELNELQDILNHRFARAVSMVFGSRALYTGTYTVSSGKLKITNEYVVVDGDILNIPTTVDFPVAIGDAIYINRIETTLGKFDPIKKFGNIAASETVPNQMQDDRITAETTKRLQVQYQLTKTNTGTGSFVKICDIINVSGQPTVSKVGYNDSPLLKLVRDITIAEVGKITIDQLNTYSKQVIDQKDAATLQAMKDWAAGFGVGAPKTITAGDFNTITTPGFYGCVNCSNAPVSMNLFGLFVTGTSATEVIQVAVQIATGTTYTRKLQASTWAPWVQLETTSGAQAKATQALNDAKTYADGKETPSGAQAKVDAHANRKDNPHGITPSQIGAETPQNASSKADAALASAKQYVDGLLPDYAITIGKVQPAKGLWFKVLD